MANPLPSRVTGQTFNTGTGWAIMVTGPRPVSGRSPPPVLVRDRSQGPQPYAVQCRTVHRCTMTSVNPSGLLQAVDRSNVARSNGIGFTGSTAMPPLRSSTCLGALGQHILGSGPLSGNPPDERMPSDTLSHSAPRPRTRSRPGGTDSGAVEFAAMSPCVMLVSDALMMPPEEGVRRTAHELASCLEVESEFRAIGPPGSAPGHLPLLRGRLPGPGALGAVARFRPERLVFVPYHGMTTAGWVRLLLIAAAAPSARLLVLHAQPIPQTNRIARMAARLLRHRLLFLAASPECESTAGVLPIEVQRVTLGVDTRKFSPVTDAERTRLRNEFGFDAESTVVLHVGHPTPGRGLDRIARLADEGFRVVLVLSGGTEWGDNTVVPQRPGLTVRTGYEPDLENLYRAADVYVFAVDDVAVHHTLNARAAIGTPLSVLEALACGTPVVTTRFGALPEVLSGRPDVAFVDGDECLAPFVRKLAGTRGPGDGQGWEELIQTILHS